MLLIILLIQKLASTLYCVLFLLAIFFVFRHYKKKKLSKFFLILSVSVFLLTSTYYFPHYIAKRLESKFPPLEESIIKQVHGRVYIHVLGSGYTPYEKYPATTQMGLVALGRMSEAIRLYRLSDSAFIITSGKTVSSAKTQAQVLKDALTEQGVESGRIETLDTPGTTMEESEHLANKFGKNIKLIVVTDALHMPRAMGLFKKAGFNDVIAAPINFKTIESEGEHSYRWLPSIKNMTLTDQVLHEYLAGLRSIF
jgi:uncharacterized SAM-binding protein YcdF (DUF218 family)